VREDTTAALRRLSPGWAWARENFKRPALLTIAALVVGGTFTVLQQRAELLVLKRNQPKLEKISEQLAQVLQEQAAQRQRMDYLGTELARQGAKWERVEEAADIRIPRRRH